MKHTRNATTQNPGAQRVKDQAARLSQYLESQSIRLTRTQGLEAVSHAVHGKPWNVVRTLSSAPAEKQVAGRQDGTTGATLVRLEADGPISLDSLMRITEAGRYYLDVAVPLAIWDILGNDLDGVNDKVSELITGSIVGLQDISLSRYDLPEGQTLSDQVLLIRVVAQFEANAFDAELGDYLAVDFVWVYPDEDGDRVRATVDLRTGEVLLQDAVPNDIRASVVRTRLEDEDGVETVDVHFDEGRQIWLVRPSGLKNLRNW